MVDVLLAWLIVHWFESEGTSTNTGQVQPHPFVSIYERVVLGQGVSECGRFLYGRGIQLFSSELHLRLSGRRNESAPIPQPRASSRRFDQAPMEIKDFGGAQVPHDTRRP